MTDPLLEPIDAYSLLSKPTLDLNDAEVNIVIEDLRRRRKAYLASGKPDKPRKETVARQKASAGDKAANTAALLAHLNLKV